MRIKNKRLFILEIIGSIFVVGGSFLLHYLYEFSDYHPVAGVFGAANESVWEHAKILFLPYFIWTILELFLAGVPFCKMIVAKAVGLFSTLALTIIFFYAYSGVLGKNYVVVDIISAIVWAFVSHLISYKIAASNKEVSDASCVISILAIGAMLIMFFSFTLFPPRIPLFRDNNTGDYGLEGHSVRKTGNKIFVSLQQGLENHHLKLKTWEITWK